MSIFRKIRKDWQIDQVLDRLDAGLISDAEAGEQIQLIEERFDRARRRRENIG